MKKPDVNPYDRGTRIHDYNSWVDIDAIDQIWGIATGEVTENSSPSPMEAKKRDEAYSALHDWIFERARS